MKKIAKNGLILAMLMAGSANAALVKVDLTGTISSGGQGTYDYNYTTGVYNSSYNNLTDTQAHVSFLFDTAKAPDQSYNDSYSGTDWWSGGNYSYSYSLNYFGTAVSAFSANVGTHSVTFDSLTAYTQNYSQSSDYWGNYTSNATGIYSYNSSYSGNTYNYRNIGISNSSTTPVNVQDFLSGFLSSTNPISFYLYNQSYTWNNDAYVSNYFNAQGTFNSVSVSSVPVPAAVWLFGSSLMGLFGFKKKKGMMPILTA